MLSPSTIRGAQPNSESLTNMRPCDIIISKGVRAGRAGLRAAPLAAIRTAFAVAHAVRLSRCGLHSPDHACTPERSIFLGLLSACTTRPASLFPACAGAVRHGAQACRKHQREQSIDDYARRNVQKAGAPVPSLANVEGRHSSRGRHFSALPGTSVKILHVRAKRRITLFAPTRKRSKTFNAADALPRF